MEQQNRSESITKSRFVKAGISVLEIAALLTVASCAKAKATEAVVPTGDTGPSNTLTVEPPTQEMQYEQTIGQGATPEAGDGGRTYESVKDAFTAIQEECMVFPNWPGRIDAWVETVDKYLAEHPEIHVVPGNSWGGSTEMYDGSGYCFVTSLPTEPTSVDENGVLIYLAMGDYGPVVDSVRFEGPTTPIYETEEKPNG